MAILTKQQRKAVFVLYQRDNQDCASYIQFRRSLVFPNTLQGCVMVHWCNKWLGVEADGYTHE